MKPIRMCVICGFSLLLAACGASSEAELPAPTVMQLSSLTPSITPTPSSTPSPTPTASPTPSATPSITPSPTASATPTNSPTATLSATPPPNATPVQLVVVSDVGAYARSGPGQNYDIVGQATGGEQFDLRAYAYDDASDIWYLVTLPGGLSGWISWWVAGPLDNVPLAQIALAATIPASPTAIPPSPTETLPPTPDIPAGADALTTSESGVNLRSGAGVDYSRLTTLSPSTPLQLVGRNADATWVQVTTPDGQQGWIMAELLDVAQPDVFGRLTLSWVEPGEATAAAAVTNPYQIALSPAVLQQARDIYQHGQILGNQPNALLQIGDSVNVEGNFLHSFANHHYRLGEYAYLQPVIDFFAASGLLHAAYLTEHAGFKYDMILDPTWADPRICEPGETPLYCEVRTKKPSIAIIHLALNDMLFYPMEDYRTLMNQVIQTLIGYGVIPVLTTFTAADDFRPDQTPLYNQAIRETAASFNIPLIDFNDAARTLPHRGTGEDGAHLSYPEDWLISFEGDQEVYGVTLRELLTWLMLNELWNNVIQPAP